MNRKKIGIIVAIVLILTGTFVQYFWAYKDNIFINYAYAAAIFFGWFALTFLFFGKRLLNERKIYFKKNKSAWIKDKLIKAASYLFLGIPIIANFTLVDDAAQKRINNILDKQPTQKTVATVEKIVSKNSRGGTRYFAILKYAAQDKMIEQSVSNAQSTYAAGQKYIIRYAVEYPDMFYIIRSAD